ncbi:hypothetical protein WFZ85_13430 [Flavobacterium sp. j3]|uniref:Uncharacterized protein n=1 Tax=Flavobacterium aureirubrum TaxID=3133147 RepID=A0ABU9N9S4_9FLAO
MKYLSIWKTFFEYFFYRIAKLNIKFTKPDRAIASVSGVQFLIVLNIIIFFYSLLVPHTKRSLNYIEIIFILALLFIINYLNIPIYEGRYEEFDKRWGNETRKRKIIGFIIVFLTIIFSFGLFFINSWIFDRFNKYL